VVNSADLLNRLSSFMTGLFPKRLTFITTLLVTVSACSDGQSSVKTIEDNANYKYSAPVYLNDGWQVGHLDDYGFDHFLITELVDNINNDNFPGIDSLSIVRRNTLVLHQDFRTSFSVYDEWIENENLHKHIMHSTSKSFVSALTGIAVQQGYLPNADTPFYQLFDYASYDNWSINKEQMKLEDVLTMRLGLEWDEWSIPYSEAQNSLTNLVENNHDYVKALLDLSIITEPGDLYAYNTAASIALGYAIELSTNMPLAEFAEINLFAPMQIENAEWLTTPTDNLNTGSGLFLETRDMAKFGQLYLDKGIWNGYQLLNAAWVEKSLQKHVSLNWDYTSGYGFQWWLGDFELNDKTIPFYSTRGYGGQFIIIVPEYDLVVAFTGQNYNNDLYDSPFRLVEDYILPAISL